MIFKLVNLLRKTHIVFKKFQIFKKKQQPKRKKLKLVIKCFLGLKKLIKTLFIFFKILFINIFKIIII